MNPVSGTLASEPIAAPAPVLCETPQPRSVLAAPAPPLPMAVGNRMDHAAATDRLSAIFNELVESALEARLLGLAERLGARVEARIAETETATLTRLEQQIHGVIAAQTERLENHTVDLVTCQQQLLEQNVQKLLQDTAANALRWQQESLETHRQVMRNEMTELVMSRKAQLEQETSELASAVYTNLAQSIAQELPSIEKQFAEQCRAQTEQLLATRMEELDRRCADRVQEADQSVNQRMEKVVAESMSRFATGFEARSELLRAKVCGQLEQQIEQIGHQARQAFLRHIVIELKQKQQLWLQQAQKELTDLAEQKLQRTRQSLSTVMKEFGETLIRGTYPEVGVLAAVSSEISGREGVRQTARFAENEGSVQPEEVTGVVTCNPGVRLA